MSAPHDHQDDIQTLRQAAEHLRGLRDVDMEELALASRFEAVADALTRGVAVRGGDAVLRAAQGVLKARDVAR